MLRKYSITPQTFIFGNYIYDMEKNVKLYDIHKICLGEWQA